MAFLFRCDWGVYTIHLRQHSICEDHLAQPCFLLIIEQFIVVPLDTELVKRSDFDVSRIFFERTFGTLSANGNVIAVKVFHAFVAISALGNLIVMTYTAARGRPISSIELS